MTGQLVEAATGRHVWADKIEGGVEEVFDFQDRITECVVGAIQPSLLEAEAERLRPRATDSLSAYELYLRALPLLDRVSREGCSDAKVLLTKATEADPQFGVAYATAAQCHVQRLFQGWSDDPPREESEGMILVSAALEKGNDDAEVLWRAGFALSAFGGDLDRCLAMLKRALELSPNSAHAWQWLGWVQVYAGQYERAAGAFERARRLSCSSWNLIGRQESAPVSLDRAHKRFASCRPTVVCNLLRVAHDVPRVDRGEILHGAVVAAHPGAQYILPLLRGFQKLVT